MSLHTLPEYARALESTTGIPRLSVDVIPSLSQKSRADIICVLDGSVELWQFRDMGNLELLGSALPKTLHADQEDLKERRDILRLSQTPNGAENLSQKSALFSGALEKILMIVNGMTDPMEISRELRSHIEHFVWHSNEFTIARIHLDAFES